MENKRFPITRIERSNEVVASRLGTPGPGLTTAPDEARAFGAVANKPASTYQPNPGRSDGGREVRPILSWALAIRQDLPLFAWGFVWASLTYGFFYLVGGLS